MALAALAAAAAAAAVAAVVFVFPPFMQRPASSLTHPGATASSGALRAASAQSGACNKKSAKTICICLAMLPPRSGLGAPAGLS